MFYQYISEYHYTHGLHTTYTLDEWFCIILSFKGLCLLEILNSHEICMLFPFCSLSLRFVYGYKYVVNWLMQIRV